MSQKRSEPSSQWCPLGLFSRVRWKSSCLPESRWKEFSVIYIQKNSDRCKFPKRKVTTLESSSGFCSQWDRVMLAIFVFKSLLQILLKLRKTRSVLGLSQVKKIKFSDLIMLTCHSLARPFTLVILGLRWWQQENTHILHKASDQKVGGRSSSGDWVKVRKYNLIRESQDDENEGNEDWSKSESKYFWKGKWDQLKKNIQGRNDNVFSSRGPRRPYVSSLRRKKINR